MADPSREALPDHGHVRAMLGTLSVPQLRMPSWLQLDQWQQLRAHQQLQQRHHLLGHDAGLRVPGCGESRAQADLWGVPAHYHHCRDLFFQHDGGAVAPTDWVLCARDSQDLQVPEK